MLSTSKEPTRLNFQALPKMIMKWRECKIENFLEKSTLKVKTSSKFVLWQPEEICRFYPKSLNKIIGKRAKNSYWGYPTEFAPEASTITGLKLNLKYLNLKKSVVSRLKGKKLRE
jgi:hypothetical protein